VPEPFAFFSYMLLFLSRSCINLFVLFLDQIIIFFSFRVTIALKSLYSPSTIDPYLYLAAFILLNFLILKLVFFLLFQGIFFIATFSLPYLLMNKATNYFDFLYPLYFSSFINDCFIYKLKGYLLHNF
jgi:hypothetical protein